jgi:hypothetical protein
MGISIVVFSRFTSGSKKSGNHKNWLPGDAQDALKIMSRQRTEHLKA